MSRAPVAPRRPRLDKVLNEPRLRAAAMAALAAVGYFVSARLGYAFAIHGGLVTLWPPSGVILGLLVAGPRRDWPSVVAGALLGSMASDLASGYALPLAIGAALANVVESIVAAVVVTRLVSSPVTLTRVRSVTMFALGAAIASNALTSLVGALVLTIGFRTPFPQAWFTWWAADGLGMMVVAPVLLTWPRQRTPGRALRVFEAAALIALIVTAGELGVGQTAAALGVGPYITFPGLFLAAVRFGSFGASIASLLIGGIALWAAALGAGPFVAPSMSGIETALRLYVYLSVASTTSLILAAALEQQRVAAERKAESDRRYRGVVETVNDVILVIDSESRIQLANAAVETVFGYRPDELVGRSLTELMPQDLRPRHREALAHYTATAERRIDWRGVRLRGRHRDGHEIPIEVSFSETQEGSRRSFTGIIRDVTEKHRAQQALQEAEERMRFSLAAARVGIWEVEQASGRAHWSETLEALHGIAPGTFAGSLDAFLERAHPEDRPCVQAAIADAFRARTDFTIQYRTTWPDGSTHWISGFGRTFEGAAGEKVRAAGIAMDITERRAMEEQRLQTQKMETIGQLAGGVAHDFNNLLTAILGHTMLMAQALGPGSPHHSDLAEIRIAAERATSLTAQLLAFSRRQILAPRVLDLGAAVTALAPMLRRLIGETIDIVVHVSPDAGHVLADSGQIDQVVLNLALNARDAMPDGGRLVIAVRAADPRSPSRPDARPGPHVLLTVTDTGLGMDASTVARIFEPFFTTKPKGKGTGLGLSTVYGIVMQSGGWIDVQSEPQRGSAFKVYLPQVDRPAAQSGPETKAVPARGNEAVLVVEDDERIRKIAVRVLSANGYHVTTAASPEEALDIATRGARFDVLVTDVVLPRMSGRALAERLSTMSPELRVLYMSGYTDEDIGRYGVFESGIAFLEKPFTPGTLLNKVRDTLDARPG